MRIINRISNVLFFTGLILKLFHIHYHTILLLVGLAGVLISLAVGLLKREEKESLLLNLTNLGWLVLIFTSVKFLPAQKIIVVIALFLTLLTSIYLIRKKKTKTLSTVIVSIILGLFFFFLPTHKRYNLLSIRWNHEIETDYITWDKYSWFLYQNGEFAKASDASERAKTIAVQLGEQDWVEFIEKHKKSIAERTWKKYR